ncbi:stimulated by retinoic acid gene 6 protein-like [Branchiostoma floridae]|uniref:Stimulated by retinoic acid gene 6 protein-like n=1 Tax=Branchiostoma floridae TaxID=7739 RepID=A0A9J7KHS2_BRAFL|nr:stimulated by retinoic acid gene 6 protein-like [Branchiostoma floridae]
MVPGCYLIAFVTSSVLLVCYMLCAFVRYRTHRLRLQRGDKSFLPRPRDLPHPGNMLSESMKYSGIQIAYFLWGYYMLQLMLYLVTMVISYFLVLPLLGVVSSFYLQPLWTLLPTVVLSLLVNYVQIFVSRKALLQDHCYKDGGSRERVKALALDNRRVYHNFSYFLFFFNILLGFYSCLLRIVKGILLGLVFLARVDLSGLMQGYQHWDFGKVIL